MVSLRKYIRGGTVRAIYGPQVGNVTVLDVTTVKGWGTMLLTLDRAGFHYAVPAGDVL